jgi:hypothetical protein
MVIKEIGPFIQESHGVSDQAHCSAIFMRPLFWKIARVVGLLALIAHMTK